MKRIIVLIMALTLTCAFASAGAVSSESAATTQKAPKKGVEYVTFKTNLHCANCAKKVQENIAYEKGVKSLDVSLEKQTIKIGYDATKTDPERLAIAIRKLGYPAEIQ